MRKEAILIPMLFMLLSFCWLPEAVAAGAQPSCNPPPSETLPSAPASGEQPGIDVARLESRIHDLVNLERRRFGLPELAWNRALNQIARNYSRNMATQRFFSHTDPEAHRFTDRYWRDGFNCAPRMSRKSLLSLGGENIAYNSLCRAIA